MTEIAPTQTPSPAPNAQSGADTPGAALTSDFETFLKMLTVQLKNQDPLNLIESHDYAVQLATFSGVEQQVRTNTLLESLSSQMGGSTLAQYADWAGREVRAPGAVAYDGAPVALHAELPAWAETAELVVRDATGAEVQRLAIPAEGGAVTWTSLDGGGLPLPGGAYTFESLAYRGGADPQSGAVEIYRRVSEIRQDGSGPLLILADGTALRPGEVTAPREAGF